MNCPNCSENTLVIIGSAYDEDVYIGTAYECLNCDFSFTIDDEGNTDADDPNEKYSIRL